MVISRTLFSDLCQLLCKLTTEESKTIAIYSLDKIQPRAISFEDQVTNYRQFLSEIYEREGDFKKAANILSGIPLETSQKFVQNIFFHLRKIYLFFISRQYQNDFKLKTYIKIAELFLEEGDSVQAEVNLSRAAALEKDCKVAHLQVKYKACQARVWDFKRKFIEAASKYYELSYHSLISDFDKLDALNNALNCTILAPAGK